jgi:hypothetical protein
MGKTSPSAAWKAIAACLVCGGLSAGEAGWYRLKLDGSDPIEVRIVAVDGDAYSAMLDGHPLRIPERDVKSIEKMDRSSHSAGPEPGSEAGDGAEIREALQGLASSDAETLDRSRKLLSERISDCRPLLHAVLFHESLRVRCRALAILGESGTEKDDLQAVAGRLADGDAEVRRSALVAIRQLGPRGLPAVTRHLPGEKDASNRKVAVHTLIGWNDFRGAPALVDLLDREEDASVRGLTVAALQILTGGSLGEDAGAWRTWLDEQERLDESMKVGRSLPAVEDAPEAGR